MRTSRSGKKQKERKVRHAYLEVEEKRSRKPPIPLRRSLLSQPVQKRKRKTERKKKRGLRATVGVSGGELSL